MIAGIGTDLCDVRRIDAALRRHGLRFAQRILGPQEWAEFERRLATSSARAHRYLATRFAAKEALAKAIGLGMRHPMGWQACEVVSDPLGRPALQCHGALAAWLAQRQWQAHLSLTDEAHHALAFVVVEHQP
ncbi:holo-ACP synthase [Aquabacterium fontiphilum]|jgi:holo-[acyl-carrier-protein] synthase|uniref:holo-ACP synthase n=1 Tax=Aquabacterium fontiphilum TaxID=450365 RepID=UPI00137683E8|nr:holo-ACP synthase [Aquabacterium fontiphilum]NBD21550.1 holo-ACP synthase [Aquabacterium fontiphilum]